MSFVIPTFIITKFCLGFVKANVVRMSSVATANALTIAVVATEPRIAKTDVMSKIAQKVSYFNDVLGLKSLPYLSNFDRSEMQKQ